MAVIIYISAQVPNRCDDLPLLPGLIQFVCDPAAADGDDCDENQQHSQAELKPAAFRFWITGVHGGSKWDSALPDQFSKDKRRRCSQAADCHRLPRRTKRLLNSEHAFDVAEGAQCQQRHNHRHH